MRFGESVRADSSLIRSPSEKRRRPGQRARLAARNVRVIIPPTVCLYRRHVQLMSFQGPSCPSRENSTPLQRQQASASRNCVAGDAVESHCGSLPGRGCDVTPNRSSFFFFMSVGKLLVRYRHQLVRTVDQERQTTF